MDVAVGTSSAGAAATAAASWSRLLRGPLPLPHCHCGIPAVERQVVKESDRKGQHFYACAKPEGRKGDPGARCGFFLFQSAWRKQLGELPPPAAIPNAAAALASATTSVAGSTSSSLA